MKSFCIAILVILIILIFAEGLLFDEVKRWQHIAGDYKRKYLELLKKRRDEE